MSLVGKIQSLFLDREKTQPIFPITKVKAVSDDNGKGLNVLLDDKASKDFVTAKIAEAQLGGGGGEIDLSGFATKDDLNAVNDKIPTTPEQIGAHPNTWLPTIAQIGAVPSWYGLGELGAYCSDCNNALKNGWFWVDGNTTNIPESGTSGALFVESRNKTGSIDYYQTLRNGNKIFYRYYSSYASAWQPWIRCDAESFAPAGFGLGEPVPPTITTFESTTPSGWYFLPADNSPTLAKGVVHISNSGNNCNIIDFWDENGLHLCRKLVDGWGYWEFVNPPMIPGNVYRTTKRHGGKPVYTYCIAANIGLEDAGGYRTRWFNHLEAAASMVDIISVKAKVHPIGSNSNQVLPAIGSDGTTSINAFNTGFSIYSTKATNVDYIYAEFEFTME